MYSVVLMMAITTGGEAPDCHRGGGGGCCGAVASGGCYGGGGGHLFGGRHGHGGGCGCYGGGYGGGCYGGGYGGGCYGGGYGGGCYGGGYGGCYGGGMYYGAPIGEPIKPPTDKKPEDKKPIGALGAPARIIVSMPADSRFTIDGYTSPARSDTHIIVSGPLGAEETRTYVLKAEVLRDGKVQTIEERVTVRSGEETKVTLSLPTSVAAR
jgi:uncharacterized protein (TIGR03000 family)